MPLKSERSQIQVRRHGQWNSPVGKPVLEAPEKAARLLVHLAGGLTGLVDDLVSGVTHCEVRLLRGLEPLLLGLQACKRDNKP